MPARRNTSLVVSLCALVVGMFLLVYASVPLYRLFCQVTGFGGTTQEAEAAPGKVYDREITVRFNADTDNNLPWEFKPLQASVKVKVGENKLIAYQARNLTNEPITGQAVFNVTPFEAGPYFDKIQCFCFSNQTLHPNQTLTMPVSFFIDPKIMDDRNLRKLDTITLSYTFYRSEP